MNFTYEHQGATTYLVYSLRENEQIDTASLGMLTNNKVPGLAPVLYTQIDTARYIKYNVSSKVSLRQFFTGIVNRQRLIGVFGGIVDAILYAEDYMLDAEAIVLDLDYIFVDVSTCEPALICVLTNSSVNTDLSNGAFFKEIMFTTQFDQRENCDYVARIMNFLNGSTFFQLQGFKELLDTIKEDMAGTSGARQVVPYSSPARPSSVPAPAAVPSSQKSMSAPKPAPMPPVTPPQQQSSRNTVTQSSEPQIPPGLSPKEQKKWLKQRQKLLEKLGQSPSAQPMPSAVPTPAQPTPMAVPPSTMAVPPAPAVQPGALQPGEKPMSFIGLMRNYSKENVAKYKEQKAAQKAMQGAMKTPAEPPVQTPQNGGFAIPGQTPGLPQPPVQPPRQQPAPTPAPKPVTAPAPAPTPAPAPSTQATPDTPPQAYQSVLTTTLPGATGGFGETVVLNAADGPATTLLVQPSAQARVRQPYLIRMKTNEKIALNKPLFRVGKERSYVDYYIGDNTAISRSHASFTVRDGECYVMDTNSTNHTFINGIIIQSNVETKLTNGDKVKLANEEFEFRLY